jgi:signal transduction histidine kinase
MNHFLIYGSIVMVFLAISIVLFVLFYQRKMYLKQQKINELEIVNQRELLQAEINATERTQKRIAQELHDQTGASLTSLRFYIAQMGDDVNHKDKMNQMIIETADFVKNVCNEMLPYTLSEAGLIGSISEMTDRLNETTWVKVKFVQVEIDETIKLTPNEELAMYRIVQELLNSIIKYAESTYVDLFLTLNTVELKLEIVDDGTGVIPSLDGHTNSFGLRNIVSRLQYINAEMVRTTRSQRGTTVLIRKALNEKENHNRSC